MGDGRSVTDAVIAEFRSRDALGRRKYGCCLQPFNGRDALRDARDEALDNAAYLTQAIMERDAVNDREHLLTCLMEECAEIIEVASRVSVRASKALRFGLDEIQPGQDRTNAQRLADELGDLLGVAGMLKEAGVIPDGAEGRKALKVERFMEHARECGALEVKPDRVEYSEYAWNCERCHWGSMVQALSWMDAVAQAYEEHKRKRPGCSSTPVVPVPSKGEGQAGTQ